MSTNNNDITMGLFKSRKHHTNNGPYLEDLYEEYYGKKPKSKITPDEETELLDYDEECWEEDL